MHKNYNIRQQVAAGLTFGAVGATALGILSYNTSHNNIPEAVKSTATIPPMFKVDHRAGRTLLQGCFRRFTSNQPGTVGTLSMPVATNDKWRVTFTDYGTGEDHVLDLEDIDDSLMVFTPGNKDGLYQGEETMMSKEQRSDEVVRCTLGLPPIPSSGNPNLDDFDGKYATVVGNEIGGLSHIDGPYDPTTRMGDYGPETWVLNRWVLAGRVSVVDYPLLDPPYDTPGVR